MTADELLAQMRRVLDHRYRGQDPREWFDEYLRVKAEVVAAHDEYLAAAERKP